MFSGPGSDWNQKKIKTIIDYYGHQFFVHKKVLDLGCGQGDIGGVLHRLGADVTMVDARQDHLKLAGKKYPGVKIIKADLDGSWPFYGKSFDVVVDIGLLCHLKNYEEHIRNVCASTTYLILETAVVDSNDYGEARSGSDAKTADGSFNGFSSQLSADNLESLLKDCGMSFKRFDNAKMNAGSYTYDWKVSNDGNYSLGKRRIWFCVNDRRMSNHVEKTQIVSPTPIPLAIHSNPGAFNNALADSKIPVVHQPITTTRSPSVPIQQREASVTSITPPRNKRTSVSGVPRVRLFYGHYEDKNPVKRQEIDTCLYKNIENPLFEIIIVSCDEIPTYQYMFEAVNRVVSDKDVSIICNADIFFDDTIKQATRIQPNQIYVLSGWNTMRDNFASLSGNNLVQEAWIVRGPVNNVNTNFQMGRPGSSARLAYEFGAAGYTVLNPSKSIKAYHIDKTGVIQFTEEDRVSGPYLGVDPTAF